MEKYFVAINAPDGIKLILYSKKIEQHKEFIKKLVENGNSLMVLCMYCKFFKIEVEVIPDENVSEKAEKINLIYEMINEKDIAFSEEAYQEFENMIRKMKKYEL